MSLVAYFIIFLIAIILILIIVIIILAFVIKNYKNKERRLYHQKLLDRDKFKQNLKDKKGFYDEKAKKANNINDLLDLTNKLMQDGYYPD